ncbi:MAG: hypothetical protein PVF89_03860 [Lysobacterales bacterium]|jgi:hypothetical protein
MGMWTAIALICIAGAVASIFKGHGKYRHSEETAKKLTEMEAKIDAMEHELRNRVETLERIVTNPKEDLKRRFDDLEKVS